jgi:hypothetical protein
MSGADRMTTPVAGDVEEMEGRYATLDGCTVGFETFRRAPRARGRPSGAV